MRLLCWIQSTRRQRRPDVLLRNARWVAEARDIPTLWNESNDRPPRPGEFAGH